MARSQTRHIFCALGQIRFAILQNRSGRARFFSGSLEAVLMPLRGFSQFARFPFQTLNRFARIAV